MRTSITATKEARSISRRTLTAALLIIVLAGVAMPLDQLGLLRSIKGSAQAILAPTEERLTHSRLGIDRLWFDLIHVASLSARNTELERQVSDLQARVIQLESLQSQNDALARELGIRQVSGWVTLSASVVQSTAENGRRMIRVARGKVDGVTLGMAVVAKEGGSPPSLVGIVDRVYAQTSDILLITDGAFSMSARTTTRSPASGLIMGEWQIGSRTRLEEVDRDATLDVGDVVVSAGLSKAVASDTPLAQVPQGVPIGVVIDVTRNNYRKSAEVKPFIDPDRVRDVWIVTREQTK